MIDIFPLITSYLSIYERKNFFITSKFFHSFMFSDNEYNKVKFILNFIDKKILYNNENELTDYLIMNFINKNYYYGMEHLLLFDYVDPNDLIAKSGEMGSIKFFELAFKEGADEIDQAFEDLMENCDVQPLFGTELVSNIIESIKNETILAELYLTYYDYDPLFTWIIYNIIISQPTNIIKKLFELRINLK